MCCCDFGLAIVLSEQRRAPVLDAAVTKARDESATSPPTICPRPEQKGSRGGRLPRWLIGRARPAPTVGLELPASIRR